MTKIRRAEAIQWDQRSWLVSLPLGGRNTRLRRADGDWRIPAPMRLRSAWSLAVRTPAFTSARVRPAAPLVPGPLPLTDHGVEA